MYPSIKVQIYHVLRKNTALNYNELYDLIKVETEIRFDEILRRHLRNMVLDEYTVRKKYVSGVEYYSITNTGLEKLSEYLKNVKEMFDLRARI